VPVVEIRRESQWNLLLPCVAELRHRLLERRLGASISGKWRISAREKYSLLRHLTVMLRRQSVPVGDDVDPRVDRTLRSLRSLNVALDFAAAFRRLIDRELYVIDGVTPWFAVDAQLDSPRAKQHVFANRADDLVRAVCIDVFGKDDV